MAQSIIHITLDQLGRWLHRVRDENWQQLVLLGPDVPIGRADTWPQMWRAAPAVFQLTSELGLFAGTLPLLPQVTSLDLSSNKIVLGGAEAIAKRFPGLIELYLGNNDIGDRGAEVVSGALIGLTSLHLARNNISDSGAKAISETLTSLISLDLADNEIGDSGAKAISETLTGLLSLNLADNEIGDAGAKAIVARLNELTALRLFGNKIGSEGARALLDAWSSGRRAQQLMTLDLRENTDLVALIPKEVLETTDAQAILAAYRSFVVAEAQQTLRPLNELKLIVVGNEAVGKTSLLRYLIAGEPRDPSEAKTPGIAQHEKIQVRGWSPHGCEVQLNVWDFGGQEMMRGTHRFFLTERSLYLLVLEDRRQDDRSIYDWLKTIRNRGSDSPVIVVINKSDAGKQDLRLDETSLRESYPSIVAFLRTSCDPGEWAARSIMALRGTIVETIGASDRLKHVRDPIPANWLRIKDRVRELADQRSVLPHADFIALCNGPGDGTEPVRDNNEQRALLRLLHELGAIVAHGLERDAPAARREITLLDPNWLTGAVYRILEKASSVDQEGEFARSELASWLGASVYPREWHEFILDMMQDHDIGLCFRLPSVDGERYLVPEALPGNRRVYEKWPDDSLRFRYTYNYLPPGLLPRFIVQAHQNLAPGKFRWRTGVVLVVIDCDILVTADPDQRRVEVAVKGPVARRRAALNVVLNHLETVHALNPEAEPTALVPLPDRPDVHVRYQHLLRLEELEGSDHSFIPDGANAKYRVGDLLNGVRRDASTTRGLREAALARENAIGSNTRGLFVRERKVAAQPDGKMQIGPRKGKEWTPMSAFISYSHRDERLRRELEKHLSGLQRQGIISSWCDRKIGAGAEWQGELDTQLEEARLILLLVSVDFINSNYCYDVEMKRALSRHDEADALVIPIMLRPVSLAGTPLAKLQALPRGLKPVMNWSNRDSAFVDIAEGLRDAIEKFADARPKRV